MKREIKECTIHDRFAEDFVGIVEKHAKFIIVSGFALDKNEITKIKAQIRRLRLS